MPKTFISNYTSSQFFEEQIPQTEMALVIIF